MSTVATTDPSGVRRAPATEAVVETVTGVAVVVTVTVVAVTVTVVVVIVTAVVVTVTVVVVTSVTRSPLLTLMRRWSLRLFQRSPLNCPRLLRVSAPSAAPRLSRC
jgi:hypothetical protein